MRDKRKEISLINVDKIKNGEVVFFFVVKCLSVSTPKWRSPAPFIGDIMVLRIEP